MKVSGLSSQIYIVTKTWGGDMENPIFHPEEFTLLKFHKMEFFCPLNFKCTFILSVNIM